MHLGGCDGGALQAVGIQVPQPLFLLSFSFSGIRTFRDGRAGGRENLFSFQPTHAHFRRAAAPNEERNFLHLANLPNLEVVLSAEARERQLRAPISDVRLAYSSSEGSSVGSYGTHPTSTGRPAFSRSCSSISLLFAPRDNVLRLTTPYSGPKMKDTPAY